MTKLLERGVLAVEKPKTYQNVVIFDWDDTLLCTSYFNPEREGNLDVVAETYKEVLVLLQNTLLDLFQKAFENCIPIIVTNAVPGWVEFTSYKLLPKIHKIIAERIPVLSTRGLVDEAIAQGKTKTTENFKLTIFSSLKNETHIFDFDSLTNLLVIGDSNYEIDAAIKFGA
jgi:hypothetical protein